MNLYRSFGNLMEAWVNEDRTYPEPDWSGNNPEDPLVLSSDIGNNPRSESVDSGVETASCYSPCPATSCTTSTNNAEMDLFILQSNGPTVASTSQTSVLSSPGPSSSSSSSPCLCLSRTEEVPTALHLKVEQALQRTDTKHLMRSNEVLSRQPQASFLPKRHTSEIVRCQRSDSCGPRRRVNPSVAIRQMSERRPLSVEFEKQRSEDPGVEERKGLSPGLCYLEQVCQMLEEIAKQQMQNRARQMETDALRVHKDIQAADTCQSNSTAAVEELSSCDRLEDAAEELSSSCDRLEDAVEELPSSCDWLENADEEVPSSCDRLENAAEEAPSSCDRLENAEDSENISNKLQQRKIQHFRRRSASDTALAVHLRKLNENCRGQQRSTNDLLETVEEDYTPEELTKKQSNRSKKSWRLKIGSLRRGEYAFSDTKGQQMQSFEKNSVSRRLSQLFRRRKKALPV